jgi:hypothetical protein
MMGTDLDKEGDRQNVDVVNVTDHYCIVKYSLICEVLLYPLCFSILTAVLIRCELKKMFLSYKCCSNEERS